LLRYRHEVKEEHPIAEVRDVLKLKWDLFVPFVSLAVRLNSLEFKEYDNLMR
jgi:hypothetical protein